MSLANQLRTTSADGPCSEKTEEAKYEVNFGNLNVLQDVFPVAMPELLQEFSNTGLTEEVLRQMRRQKLLSDIGLAVSQSLLTNPTLSCVPTSPVNSVGCLHPRCKNTCPLLASADAFHENFPYPLDNHYTSTVSMMNSANTSEYTKNNQPKTHKPRKWIKKRYIAILTAGLLFGTFVTSLVIVYILWVFQDRKAAALVESAYYACYPIVGHWVIRSLVEFNDLARRTTENCMHLKVNISKSGNWPIGSNIETCEAVKEMHVTGSIHGNKLVDLLAKTPLISRLIIDNFQNRICLESERPAVTTRKSAYIVPLKKLVFQNMTPACTSLLDAMKNQIIFNELESLEIVGGTINSGALYQIENILLHSSKTIKRIEMWSLTVSRMLFSTRSEQLNNVDSLHLDINYSPMARIEKNFCDKFPNLQQLSFGNSSRRWKNDIENLVGCLNLKSLIMTIEMPKTESNFSLRFVPERFPQLESLEITLDLETCSKSGSNFVDGLYDLPELLQVNTEITCKCDLIFI